MKKKNNLNIKPLDLKIVPTALEKSKKVMVSCEINGKISHYYIFIDKKANYKDEDYIKEAKKQLDDDIKNGVIKKKVATTTFKHPFVLATLGVVGAIALTMTGLFTWKTLTNGGVTPEPQPEPVPPGPIPPGPVPPEPTPTDDGDPTKPLTFVCLQDGGSIDFNYKASTYGGSFSDIPDRTIDLEYQIDDGEWTKVEGIHQDLTGNSYNISFVTNLKEGQEVHLRGDNSYWTYIDYNETEGTGYTVEEALSFSTEGHFSVENNIMSLVNEDDFATNINTSPGCFAETFSIVAPWSGIYDASKLVLPKIDLPPFYYAYMFYNCDELRFSPREIMSETGSIEVEACESMFQYCSSLVTAPKQVGSAEGVVGSAACLNMFESCSQLVSAPELPAVKFEGPERGAAYPYTRMFNGCSKLSYLKVGFGEDGWAEDDSGSSPTSNWLDGAGTDDVGNLCNFYWKGSDNGAEINSRDGSTVPNYWKVIHYGDDPTGEGDPTKPLTFVCLEDEGSIRLAYQVYTNGSATIPTRDINLEYQIDDGEWIEVKDIKQDTTDYTLEIVGDLKKGQEVHLRGDNPYWSYTDYDETEREGWNVEETLSLTTEGRFSVENNIMSLMEYDDFVGKVNTSPGCFMYAFYPNYNVGDFSKTTDIYDASKLVLPKINDIPPYYYTEMFEFCNKLRYGPHEIMGETGSIGVEACNSMFDECELMLTGPNRVGGTDGYVDAGACYMMFAGCKSLSMAPELPATILEPDTTRSGGKLPYLLMFQYCYNLDYLKVGFGEDGWPEDDGSLTDNWLDGAGTTTDTPTFYWKGSDNGIEIAVRDEDTVPSNWKIVHYGDAPTEEGDPTKPLTFVSLEDDSSVYFTYSLLLMGGQVPTREINLEYQVDNGPWTEVTGIEQKTTTSSYTIEIATDLDKGQEVHLRGDNPYWSYINYDEGTESYWDAEETLSLTTKGRFSVENNIMSLMEYDDFVGKTNTSPGCLSYAFYPSYNVGIPMTTDIFDASKLVLPKINDIPAYYYAYTFGFCDKLRYAPHEIMGETGSIGLLGCCGMFCDCYLMLTGPERVGGIDGFVDGGGCSFMFSECHSLTKAPELPATNLSGAGERSGGQCSYCYMFSSCFNLSYIKVGFGEDGWPEDEESLTFGWLANDAGTYQDAPTFYWKGSEGGTEIVVRDEDTVPSNWSIHHY